MGQRELLETLRRDGDEQAAAKRRAFELEAQQLRSEAAERLQALKSAHAERCKRQCLASQQEIMARAERAAALVRLRAEDLLGRRLWPLAEACLEQLCLQPGASLLRRLAAELPPEPWAVVRVNPRDAAVAADLYPEATIETDAAIKGGLVAESADGSFMVANTLAVRLERGWPDLLPGVMAEIRGKCS